MPVYSMRNINTNEEFEATMKYSELEDYLKDNEEIIQIFTKFPGTVDSVRIGIRKPDEGFRDALREVKHNHLHNEINVR